MEEYKKELKNPSLRMTRKEWKEHSQNKQSNKN
jgi:hypothetical protein